MKATMLFKGMATMLVMTLIVAATTPVFNGEGRKATGEDLKNHLDEKDLNVKEIVEMEARYKGKNGRSQNKNLRCWLFGIMFAGTRFGRLLFENLSI